MSNRTRIFPMVMLLIMFAAQLVMFILVTFCPQLDANEVVRYTGWATILTTLPIICWCFGLCRSLYWHWHLAGVNSKNPIRHIKAIVNYAVAWFCYDFEGKEVEKKWKAHFCYVLLGVMAGGLIGMCLVMAIFFVTPSDWWLPMWCRRLLWHGLPFVGIAIIYIMAAHEHLYRVWYKEQLVRLMEAQEQDEEAEDTTATADDTEETEKAVLQPTPID